MGSLYRFRCEGCGYEAEVSGGRDYGFYIVTQTAYCSTCRELIDVVTGFFGRSTFDGEDIGPVDLNRCGTCGTGDHAPWNRGDGCPRCGAVMSDVGLVMDWD